MSSFANNLGDSFKGFIVKNGVISTAASITIGFATATFIKSFVADIVMPAVFLVMVGGVGKINHKTGSFISQFLADREFKTTNFVSELITWILIIIASFIVLDVFVRKTMSMQSTPQSAVAPSNPFVPRPPVQQQQQQPQLQQRLPSAKRVQEEYATYNLGNLANLGNLGNLGQQFASW